MVTKIVEKDREEPQNTIADAVFDGLEAKYPPSTHRELTLQQLGDHIAQFMEVIVRKCDDEDAQTVCFIFKDNSVFAIQFLDNGEMEFKVGKVEARIPMHMVVPGNTTVN